MEKPIVDDLGFNHVFNVIYCLFCEDDKTYVGRSKRIDLRYQQHEAKKPRRGYVLEHINLSSIRYRNVISPDKVLDTCEALWIAILQPDLNIQRPKLKIDSRGIVVGYCATP
ncbi:MAG TPA: GIY-YIG nuclease family protein, partial [Leptolyngbyaceae cyanobacterium]